MVMMKGSVNVDFLPGAAGAPLQAQVSFVSEEGTVYPLGEVPGVDTMGGLLVALKEVVPQPGESAVLGHLRLTAHVADERRVREVLVELVKGGA